MTKIKICGLKRPEDVSYVNEAGPEYAGFVFWEKSRRNVSFEEAGGLRAALNKDIISVGVFVDRAIDGVVALVEAGIISVVQLHGKEDASYIKALKERLDGRALIIKAFEVKDEEDITAANASSADMVLIDSGKGSGTTFDWGLLDKLKRPYFLAGGLSAENVGEAVKRLQPFAVDVSSRVETDGVKDKEKIKKFCQAVRKASADIHFD